VSLSHRDVDSTSRCPPDVCVAAVLGDASRRLVVLGGRVGMSRSLSSVYSGSVTRYLGGCLRGVVSRAIPTPGVRSTINGIAVSLDGGTLLVSDYLLAHGVHRFSVALPDVRGSESVTPRVLSPADTEQLTRPHQVYIAPDGFVFIADAGSNRVQVLTPSLDFHAYIGESRLFSPVGVCANADVVVVSESKGHRISVFNRSDGALLRQFGRKGSGRGQLRYPHGLCLMTGDRYIAVADCYNNRATVFSVEGFFIRHVGVGRLALPRGIACSACDELVVADSGHRRVVVFSIGGDLAMTLGGGDFRGIALHGDTVFAQHFRAEACVLFK
jgi:hypothetical protein